MAVSINLSTLSPRFHHPHFSCIKPCSANSLFFLRRHHHRRRHSLFLLHVSRRYSQDGGGGGLVDDARNWTSAIDSVYDGDDEDDSDEDEDRSLDLLIRFVQNVFRKISRRARKAVRSVLPPSISSQLVGFSVNGVLILAFLWVSKAFLEVVCTLGSAIFVSILLIRGVWAGVAYLQENRSYRMKGTDDDPRIWTGPQPVT